MRDPFTLNTTCSGFGAERKEGERRAKAQPVLVNGQPMFLTLAPGAAGKRAAENFANPVEERVPERDRWLSELLEACDD